MNTQRLSPDLLVVDLDGTLLRSDMLYESLWSSFGRDWRTPFRTLANLSRGKAAVKRRLAETSRIDFATLPYDEAVIAEVKRRRAAGARTVLMTASDQALAEGVAAHLGIFDEVHGSDGTLNLKSEAKVRFLQDSHPGRPYAYMGDAVADLPVWQHAALAIPVNASATVRDRAAALGVRTEPLATAPARARSHLRALRPHQWLKNLLVFLPMLAAHDLSAATFGASLLAFVGFCLVASSVYVTNDLLDLRSDRRHPRKRLRPFAAGDVPLRDGSLMSAGLFLAGLAVALALGPAFAAVLAIYYVFTLAYSLNLKRRAVVDVCVLAGLYTMRIVAGAAATGIALSVWLLAFSIFFFFALAAIKRQAELVDLVRRGKLDASGRGYTVEDVPVISMMAIGAGYVSILVMMLYVNSPAVTGLYPRPEALWGICAVLLYWISRIAMLTHRGHMIDDPVVFAVRDRNSLVCAALILVFAVAGALG